MLLLETFFYSAKCFVTKDAFDKYLEKQNKIIDEIDNATDNNIESLGKYVEAYDKYIEKQDDTPILRKKLSPYVEEFFNRYTKLIEEISKEFTFVVDLFVKDAEVEDEEELDDIIIERKTIITNKCRKYTTEYKKYSDKIDEILLETYIEEAKLEEEFNVCEKYHSDYSKQIKEFEENIKNNIVETIETFYEMNKE